MALSLGKSFNRNYNLRIPFMNTFYDIGIFFNTKTSFLLFSVDAVDNKLISEPVKINMFKNLESSKFCETFLNLHQYRGKNLDIINQIENIKHEQQGECIQIINENIHTDKKVVGDKTFYDSLHIFMYTINGYDKSFIFLAAERQHIIPRVDKKIVRTTGVQISSYAAFKVVDEYHQEYLKYLDSQKNRIHTNV